MKINILFLICSDENAYSFGETSQARVFAQHLPNDKYNCFFCVPEWAREYINRFGFTVIDYKEIPDHKFDIAVISDCLPLTYIMLEILKIRKYGRNTLNKHQKTILEACQHLISSNIPIGLIDVEKIWGNISASELEEFAKDERLNCIYNKFCLKFLKSKCLDCNPPDLFLIHLCPPSDPGEPSDKKTGLKTYFFAFSDNEFPDNKENFQSDDPKTNTKNIFMVQPIWQYNVAKKDGFVFYYFIFEKLLIHYFIRLGQIIDVPVKLTIATPDIFYYPFRNSNIEIIPLHYSQDKVIPNYEFTNLLYGSDLVLSDHILRNSFHSALLHGIQGINIISAGPKISKLNQITKEAFNIMEATLPSGTARLNTRHHFIGDNFMKLFPSVELLDETCFVDTIYKKLFNKQDKNIFEENRKRYLFSIKTLPSADAIIKDNIYW